MLCDNFHIHAIFYVMQNCRRERTSTYVCMETATIEQDDERGGVSYLFTPFLTATVAYRGAYNSLRKTYFVAKSSTITGWIQFRYETYSTIRVCRCVCMCEVVQSISSILLTTDCYYFLLPFDSRPPQLHPM